MSRRIVVFSLSILVSYFSFGVTISGSNSEYANTEINILKPADPFSGRETTVVKGEVDASGEFFFDFEINETMYIYAYLGVHRVYLFIEPGKSYQVVLPQRMDKTNADKLNPYFIETDVHLGLKNPDKDELNMQIRMFIDSFSPFFAKHNEKVFSDDVEFEQLDKDIEQLDKPFSKSKNQYFKEYREYKYGLLRFIAYQHKSKSVSDMYFKGKSFLQYNPAYVELFNLVYENYFSYFTRTEVGKGLGPAIKNKSYSETKKVLSFDKVLQPGELLDMVLLRSFYDEFYDDNYSRSAMLSIVDSIIAISDNELVKSTALSMREKVTKLLAGYEPPFFELYDIDSNLVTLNKFKGKFVYLNFCSCFSYTCLNEFVMLQNLHNKHSKYLEIVTVVIDDDVQVMKDFLVRSGYNWTFLHYDNTPQIFKEYDVRVFPTYYLIDDEGKLSMSPAPAPAEEFEGRLFKVLRAKGIL